MIPLSVLDLCPVREGGSLAETMAEAPRLAKAAEDAGYARYWVAEHHGMAGIAGGATSVVLAHVGNATRRIRLGAGGIMLPNHNPFVIA
ncbi:MAG: LLM class flavin-dependent oxidoreductase, partial [Sphingomonadales bacterium]|nr:LLM class flavin-dependent oxidoreductase [Sphingomonadales bacterium]